MSGFAMVRSRALLGLEAPAVTVEVHLANGLPGFTLVGLADTEVKEARERVRSALQNAGLSFPNNKRITVNLAPADCPRIPAGLICPLPWASLRPAGRSTWRHWTAASLPASSRWQATCGRCAALWP